MRKIGLAEGEADLNMVATRLQLILSELWDRPVPSEWSAIETRVFISPLL
jgi:hypothetical protein